MAGRSPQPSAHRRYHFHFPGVLYVLVTLLVAVGAINSQNNLLFGALGLAIGGLLVSGVLSGSGLLGLRVDRAGHGTAAVGKPLVLRYKVRNTNSLISAFAMHLDEVRRGASNWHRFFPAAHTFVTEVRAGSDTVAEARVIPERRGVARFDLVQIWTKFPFGLARKSMTFAAPLEIIVQPPDLPLRAGLIHRITARAPYGVGGERTAGLGEEFFALREYVAGDNPKLIAWKRSARTGTLIVRQQASPAPTRLWIVIRFGGTDAAGTAVDERAIALAAAVAREATAQQIAVGLAVPGADVVHSPRVGRVHLEMLLGDLAILDVERVRAPGSQRLPETALRTGACVIIHAGHVDETYGPRGSTHWPAEDAAAYFQASSETDRVLALFDRGPRRERVERSRSLRRFWVRRRRLRLGAGA